MDRLATIAWDQPWYLMTSLSLGPGRAKKLSELYAKRFDIQELFGDAKNQHLDGP